MFAFCKSLKRVDLRGINFNKINFYELDNMFFSANPNLEVLVNRSFKTAKEL